MHGRSTEAPARDFARLPSHAERGGGVSLALLALLLSAAPAEPKLLWTVKGYCHRPVWSPGGDRLLCGRKVHERGAVVWEVKGDDPAWSPDGKRVVSLVKGPNLLGLALWSAAGFGGSLRASEPTAAAWGVDGASIVFSSLVEGWAGHPLSLLPAGKRGGRGLGAPGLRPEMSGGTPAS